MLPLTLQFLIALIACAINERQQKALEYKTEEVLVLKDILKAITGKKRIDFTEGQRRRLAVAGKGLTAREREELCELVKPKTLLEWFRRIFSEKYDSSQSPRKKGRPPNPNPHAERFVKSIQFECLRHFVFFNERHLRYGIKEYISHYHEERFHQGIGGQLIRPAFGRENELTGEAADCADGEVSHSAGRDIKCRSRLGGLLNFYYQEAA